MYNANSAHLSLLTDVLCWDLHQFSKVLFLRQQLKLAAKMSWRFHLNLSKIKIKKVKKLCRSKKETKITRSAICSYILCQDSRVRQCRVSAKFGISSSIWSTGISRWNTFHMISTRIYVFAGAFVILERLMGDENWISKIFGMGTIVSDWLTSCRYCPLRLSIFGFKTFTQYKLEYGWPP